MGTPRTIEHRQEQLDRVHARIWPKQEQAGPASGPRWSGPSGLDDAELIRRATEAKNGDKFARLWRGEIAGHGTASEADLALCNRLAFWCGPDENRIADLFAQSGLYRAKWNREDYRKRTIAKALAGRTEFYTPGRRGSNGANGNGHTEANGAAHDAEPPPGGEKSKAAHDWTEPIPFDGGYDLPEFPTHLLPSVLCEWVKAEAEATQTPTALAASLALSICGAALATKIRVTARDGWTEPTNIFTVVALPPGDRKSAVFADAMVPVVQFEQEEQERTAPRIAEAASEHRQLELMVKIAEQKAAKAEGPEERRQLCREAKELAKELAAHVVPEPPQLFCDDETPENLTRILAKQGGRMLQASAEGTAFEIVKGRYSESPNFDVYLKGHPGDPLRVGRVGRDRDTVDRPALSVALAVQPDVIAGLAEQAILRGRGFLARFLYGLPVSRVGTRTINPRPVPKVIDGDYRDAVLRLWRIEGAVEDGKPAAHLLRFSPDADRQLQDFERWLEPQMADGEDLSLLALTHVRGGHSCVLRRGDDPNTRTEARL